MNKLFSAAAAAACFVTTSAFAIEFDFEDVTGPTIVKSSPADVFTPKDFDSNDNTQVIVSGFLPNTCYRTGPASAHVDSVRKVILVKNENYSYTGRPCLFIVTPYIKTIELGVVPAGDYKVVVELDEGKTKEMATLPVAQARTSSPDDYLYAHVDEISLDPKTSSTTKTLKMSGYVPGSCYDVTDLKVLYRKGNVIEVLPVVDQVGTTDCTQTAKEFSREVTLSPEWRGSTLVHIRSLNGQAINRVVEF